MQVQEERSLGADSGQPVESGPADRLAGGLPVRERVVVLVETLLEAQPADEPRIADQRRGVEPRLLQGLG